MLCKLNPEHEKLVVTENGVKVLFVHLIKAIYDSIKSALLWYEMFFTTLNDMDFVLNPYHPCIANCMINWKQYKIAFYIDDNKISHEDPKVVSMIIDHMVEHFGKLTVTRGKGALVLWHENTMNSVVNCCAKYEELPG